VGPVCQGWAVNFPEKWDYIGEKVGADSAVRVVLQDLSREGKVRQS